ncbi:MAG: hypothetical protein J6I46_15375 [Ruminococcus sp.]|nr:hypothetical protein [Ruminococcus sp.]
MEINAMKFPNCAGDISYSPGQRVAKCPYCDSILDIKADPADIALKQAIESQKDTEEARADYLEKVRKWKLKKRIFLAAEFVLTFIAYLLTEIPQKDSGLYELGMVIVLAVFIAVVAGPIWLNSVIPPAPNVIEEQIRLKKGPIQTIKSVALTFLVMLLGLVVGIMVYSKDKDNAETDENSTSDFDTGISISDERED